MAKQSWYSKQIAADEARKADMAARFSEMSERELVAELGEIERDDRAMRLDRTANQSGWERLATRSALVRAELSARRAANLDDVDAPTDAQMDEMDRFYRALNAAAADEVAGLARERAGIAARDAEIVVSLDAEPF